MVRGPATDTEGGEPHPDLWQTDAEIDYCGSTHLYYIVTAKLEEIYLILSNVSAKGNKSLIFYFD